MNEILVKIYKVSSMVIMPIIVSLCLVCKWPLTMIVNAVLASIVISSPATISLQVFAWLFKKMRVEKSFMWMLLLASIPLTSLIIAWLFADFVPGKIGFILLLGMLSSYVGILAQGISVSQFFNSTEYERKENNTID